MPVRLSFSRPMMAACLAAWVAASPASYASDDPFIGRWTLIRLSDEMKVANVGANTYDFDFGGGVEKIVVDGTDQRAAAGTTLSVAATGPNWKVVRKKDGRTLLTAIWTLSKDGNTLRDHFTQFAPNGSPSTADYAYARRAAGSGFAGRWLGTIAPLDAVIVLQVRPYQSDGLSVIIPGRTDTISVTFDGKDHRKAGASSTLSARRLDARTVEILGKSSGKITLTRQLALSRDLKTLTMTVHIAGDDDPRIYVFERQ